jgi:hypothetical protein
LAFDKRQFRRQVVLFVAHEGTGGEVVTLRYVAEWHSQSQVTLYLDALFTPANCATSGQRMIPLFRGETKGITSGHLSRRVSPVVVKGSMTGLG